MTEGPSRFLDGKTSRPHVVRVELTDQSLLVFEDGNLLAKFPYPALFVKEDWSDGLGGIFGVRDGDDIGLVISDISLYRDIQCKLLQRDKASFIIPIKAPHLLLMAIVAVAAGILILPVIAHLASWATFLVPQALEKKLGDMALVEMGREYKSCDDKIANQNLQKIVGRLMRETDDPRTMPEIYFYKSPDQNAFTLPGPNIAILTGFLKNAKNENEVAAVLAHEIGHMVKRDPLEAFIESQGLGILAMLVGSSGSYGDVAKAITVVQSLSYSRDKEFAADAYGAALAIKAGYSPVGMIGFLERIRSDPENRIEKTLGQLDFLSTHPDTKERIRRIQKNTSSQKYKASLSGAEFLRLKEACIK